MDAFFLGSNFSDCCSLIKKVKKINKRQNTLFRYCFTTSTRRTSIRNAFLSVNLFCTIFFGNKDTLIVSCFYQTWFGSCYISYVAA